MVAETHRIGWIGLGRMGYPMTERLLKAGHEVTVWNRTRAKAEPLAVKGAHIADRPGDLAGVDIR
jgi:3-hydroxyisobutyrate dehydrogenase